MSNKERQEELPGVNEAEQKERSGALEETALREGLDALDALFPFATPDSGWFREQAAEARRRRRMRLYRELALLWGAALLILALLYVTITHKPAAFLWMQAAAALAPLIGLGIGRWEVKRDDHMG
ncbi:DUF5345 family protein [Paenibacillus athensensis]|uniref:YxlC family protein n=1 Tax=Paenibacillus athensensis TaxID=1967502 RepID=A0A4Y8QAN4_9BACL|nr:DUF5345 family protein [Paenibacillus athensensis]MCD1260040.1 DUF5345 family protein [Paenibacillus athensensis]